MLAKWPDVQEEMVRVNFVFMLFFFLESSLLKRMKKNTKQSSEVSIVLLSVLFSFFRCAPKRVYLRNTQHFKYQGFQPGSSLHMLAINERQTVEYVAQGGKHVS